MNDRWLCAIIVDISEELGHVLVNEVHKTPKPHLQEPSVERTLFM
jgi:hypothetical protein